MRATPANTCEAPESDQVKYRAEIDGLRAIAVSAVLLYHFYPKLFPNGYLGVDVFFVISGYLIAGILRRDMNEYTFSFTGFYLRRIRRILPALVTMLLFASAMATCLLLAPDLVAYAKALLATLGFVANVHFFLIGGYFGTNDELKPLLHMWSLGVEEQFYLIFPILMYLALRWGQSYLLRWLLILTIVASFSANLFLYSVAGANAAFFMSPTRAWQFAVGALVAVLPNVTQYGWVGPSGAVLVAVNFIHPPHMVPAGTLLTLGTGLMLLQRWESDRSVLWLLLTARPVRYVGLISFSLYLWHWPVAVFLRYVTISEMTAEVATLGLIASIAVASLSWRFVEERFRHGKDLVAVLKFVGLGCVLLLIFSAFILWKDGLPGRHGKEPNRYASAIDSHFRCPKMESHRYGGSKACFVGNLASKNYKYALLGNSHALMYAPSLADALTRAGEKSLVVPLNGCLPTTSINISTDCLRLAQFNLHAVLNDRQIEVVIIGTTWIDTSFVDQSGRRFVDPDFRGRKAAFQRLISDIETTGRTVYLIGPVATPGFNFASDIAREYAFSAVDPKRMQVSRIGFEKQFKPVLDHFGQQLGWRFIRPHTLLCNESSCLFGSRDEAFFADATHLSAEGALRVAPVFELAIHK